MSMEDLSIFWYLFFKISFFKDLKFLSYRSFTCLISYSKIFYIICGFCKGCCFSDFFSQSILCSLSRSSSWQGNTRPCLKKNYPHPSHNLFHDILKHAHPLRGTGAVKAHPDLSPPRLVGTCLVFPFRRKREVAEISEVSRDCDRGKPHVTSTDWDIDLWSLLGVTRPFRLVSPHKQL